MFARRNQIYIGSLTNPDYYFENDQITLCPTAQAVALVGQELSIDVFSPVVSDSEENLLDILHFRTSDGQEIQTGVGQIYAVDTANSGTGSDLINLEYGTPVWYYHNGELVGKFYIDTVKRQARNKYQLNCVSAIGLLEKKRHGGDLFTASTFGTVLAHILAEGLHGSGNPVIDYVIDDDVADLPVSGWLPYASKRNNLYQLIFANGVNIVKNYDGRPRFTFVYTATDANADAIAEGSIYNGGSVEYTKPYSKVAISEHTYAAITDVEPETLFDNSTGTAVSNEEIWFDNAPVIVSSLAVEGSLTLVSATVNSAVISGNGKLTGIPYTHSMRTVSRTNLTAPEEKTVSVEDCTMVNLINSENLLNRLYAFYCPSNFIKKISNGVVFEAERCGKAYRFKNPYGELETAYLASMDITASSINKAESVWYAGYEPAGQQGLYQEEEVCVPEPDPEDPEQEITEGDWTVPDGVTEFKVILIGGGTGGGSGWPGKNGKDARTYTNTEETADLSAVWYGAEGGDGGEGGGGGSPGRVKIFTVENAVPGTTYHWSLGSGGEGGAATGFIPDTVDELRNALENENPDGEWTDAQIEAMIAQEDTNWNGSPNAGSAGTATTFSDGTTTWSTADQDGYVPTGGVYDPISDNYYALTGNKGIRGGKGGARKVESGGSFNWVTDGEDVVGDDGVTYHGGSTGQALKSVSGLPEAKLIAYGGNGAGAAVGLDRADHPHMDGNSTQGASWEVTEEE